MPSWMLQSVISSELRMHVRCDNIICNQPVKHLCRHVPEVSDLLSSFTFIPHWRVDDVMVSYAATGGSVGPHVDR